jgi:hypothetical protein
MSVPMTDKPDGKRWGGWRLAAMILALPALYVLAYGPLCFLVGTDIIGNDGQWVFHKCYEPLWVTKGVQPVDSALVRYGNACYVFGRRFARR